MRLIRFIPRALRPRRDLMQRVQPVRQSAGRPLARLTTWIEQGGLAERPVPVVHALQHAERLRAELQGTVRDTWMRLSLRAADASEAVAALSSPAPACALLHRLVLLARPAWVVELGSAFGIASVAMAGALATLGTGRFDGVELEGWKADLADRAVRALLGERGRVHEGRVEDVFPALAAARDTPLGMAFVDAVHTFDATWAHHRLLAARVAPGGLVVYDDASWSDDMRRCWAAVADAPEVTDAVLVAGRWGVARYRGAAVTPARGPSGPNGSGTS